MTLDNKHYFCSPSITHQDRTTASSLFALFTDRWSHFYRCIHSLGIWMHKYPKYLPHSSTHHTTESSPLISDMPPSHKVKVPNINNKSWASALVNIFRIILFLKSLVTPPFENVSLHISYLLWAQLLKQHYINFLPAHSKPLEQVSVLL